MTTAAAPDEGSLETEVRGAASGGALMMSDLRQAQARAERAERELERTRRSASFVVGNLLVRAAKDPRRLLTLPRDLWRIWRLRKARRHVPAPAARKAPARTREMIDLDAARLLTPRLATVPAGRGLSIAGAISEAVSRGWSPYAAVSPALPHEAAALIEAMDPDIVVIDTSAALPAQAWSHLGDPAAVDRLVAAGAMLDAAQALGRPTVLLRMTPPSHTAFLESLAVRCDLVVDGPGSSRRGQAWHPGVDPLTLATLPSSPALLDLAHWPAVAHRAPRTVALDPAALPGQAWARAIAGSTGVLAAPVAQGLLGARLSSVSALAAGRRVLAPGDRDLELLLAPWPLARHAVIAASDERLLADYAGQGPAALSAEEHRAALAAVLLGASAPVQLTLLADALGIAARPRSLWDVALLADPEIDVDRVLAQSWRPREVLVTEPLPDRGRDALHDEGIDVITLRAGDSPAMAAASAYLATQVNLRNPHDVVELLAGQLLQHGAAAHQTDARLVATR